jgi:heme-degrading monooxygenase HmoA
MDAVRRSRFRLVTMILEAVILNVRPGQESAFEAAFAVASPLIAATPGYISHQLHSCIETVGRYLLLVQWQTLESHTVNFRDSPNYVEWKNLLHHFYDPFPVVEHYKAIPALSSC